MLVEKNGVQISASELAKRSNAEMLFIGTYCDTLLAMCP